MAPVHSAEHRSDRVVLKEHVISAINAAQTVGIVEPALWWPNVQRREAWILHGAKRYSPNPHQSGGRKVRVQDNRARLLARGSCAACARHRVRRTRACAQFGATPRPSCGRIARPTRKSWTGT